MQKTESFSDSCPQQVSWWLAQFTRGLQAVNYINLYHAREEDFYTFTFNFAKNNFGGSFKTHRRNILNINLYLIT